MKKYRIDNECMRDILILYCEGKSYLWNAFFLFGNEAILEMESGHIPFI